MDILFSHLQVALAKEIGFSNLVDGILISASRGKSVFQFGSLQVVSDRIGKRF